MVRALDRARSVADACRPGRRGISGSHGRDWHVVGRRMGGRMGGALGIVDLKGRARF